ncbi:CD48 antigen-like [Lithobates pipiens]
MKMSGYWRLTVLFTLLGVLLGARAQQTVLKLVGSEVTLEPKYTGNPTEINWKINGDKLVDMELNSQDEPIFYRLQDRATIDRTNGRLTIKNLTTEDSGFYRAEVLVNSIYQYTDITLTVRACPDEPNITDQSTEENIVLYCESSTPGVTYKWFNQTESVGNKQSYSEPPTRK